MPQVINFPNRQVGYTLGVYVNLKTKQVFPVVTKDIAKYHNMVKSKAVTKKPESSAVARGMMDYGYDAFTYQTIGCTVNEYVVSEWKRSVRDFVCGRGMYSFTFNSVEGLVGKLKTLTRKVSSEISTHCV